MYEFAPAIKLILKMLKFLNRQTCITMSTTALFQHVDITTT